MPRRMTSKYKQLQFDTAIRNTERYKNILSSIVDFNNKNLDDSCLLDIMCIMYRKGIVTSNEIEIDDNLSDTNLKNMIISVNSSRRADGGFPSGYQARFWTYMRTLSELGFVYAQYNEPLKISKIAALLANNTIDDQEAFSVQSLIYNRKSPYKNVLNDFNYFKFILQVLIKLNERNMKLKYTDFIISMYNHNGNIEEYLQEITSNNITRNNILEYLSNIYGEHNRPQTVLKDYPDVVLRILRIMGYITISSHGGELYISINKNNIDYIEDLLKMEINCSEEEKVSPLSYYNRSNTYFNQFINFIHAHRKPDTINEKIYKSKLDEIVTTFEIDEHKIINLINLLITNSREYPIIEFKYIPDPLKLEFYITILLYIKFKDNMFIKPNYKIDDIGIPISHAPGNIGDIEVFGNSIYWLIEVTLIKSKVQQYNNETTSVIRHINQAVIDENTDKYLSFIAPIVHIDTERFYKVALTLSRAEGNVIYLKPYNINQFIESINSNIFEDMKEYTDSTIKSIKNISL
ncbi:MAG: AlwI family type II restriction endonuclease [Candidatus Gastranaerophilaceae bacterium]